VIFMLLRTSLSKEELQPRLDAQKVWYHQFEFTNGCRAMGPDPSERKLTALNLPSLEGKTVIDVGAFDGFFSFQAELLGAHRVVASDHFAWSWPDCTGRSNFELIRQVTTSKVEDAFVPVELLGPDTVGMHDVTLFLGVLYHAPNMVEYIQKIRSITKELLVLETLVDALDELGPTARYYPAGCLNNDSSNWWGPNIACVADMLQRVGFSRVEFQTMWELNTVARIRGASYLEAASLPVTSGRAVLHAYV
jgi:tRNA (mo5U34)-methyltransferase